MAEHRYKVVREHYGDKAYAEGDERVAAPGDVAHLVPNVLKDLGLVKEEAAAEKAEPKLKNKAEKASLKNKDEGQ